MTKVMVMVMFKVMVQVMVSCQGYFRRHGQGWSRCHNHGQDDGMVAVLILAMVTVLFIVLDNLHQCIYCQFSSCHDHGHSHVT